MQLRYGLSHLSMLTREGEGVGAGGAAAAPAPSPAPAAPDPAAPAAPSPAAPPKAPDLPKPDGNVLADAPAEPPAAPETGAETPEPIAPEAYLEKLTLPEGVAKDDSLLSAFLAGASKGGMDPESVQAVLDNLAPELQKQLKAPHEAWAKLQNDWQSAIKADAELGGDKLPATVSTINKALHAVGVMTDDLREALAVTGAGNNPHIIRAFHRLAAAISEGGPVTGAPKPQAEPKNAAAALYPSAEKP